MKKTLLTLAAIAAFGFCATAQNPVTTFGQERIPVSFIPASMMANNQPGFAILEPNFQTEELNVTIYGANFQAIGNPFNVPMSEVALPYRSESYNTETSQWVLNYEDEDYEPIIPIICAYLDLGNSGIDNISAFAVTQKLFNNNEEFEYIMPKYRTVTRVDTNYYWDWDYETGEETRVISGRETRTVIEVYGFEVKNLAGTTLQTITLPEGYTVASAGDGLNVLGIATLLGNNYIVVPAQKEIIETWNDGDETYTEIDYEIEILVYAIDANNVSISQVDVELPASVFPTLVNRGNDVTVDLGANSQAREIRVVNQLGQTVKTVNVRPGQKEVKINTRELNSGVNFINIFNSKANNTYKIVVR